MSVRVDSGYNEIVFEYDYLPIKVAMMISLCSLVITISMTVVEHKKVQKSNVTARRPAMKS